MIVGEEVMKSIKAPSSEMVCPPLFNTPIQTGLEIILERFLENGHKVRLKTYIVGYEDTGYLLVKTPKVNRSEYSHFSAGTPLKACFRLNGQAFSIQTRVMRHMAEPFHLTFLDFPSRANELCLRKSQRFDISLPLTITGMEGTKTMMRDISEGGALLQSRRSFKIGETLLCSFDLPVEGKIKALPVHLKRFQASEMTYLIGVEFEKDYPDHRKVKRFTDRLYRSLVAKEKKLAHEA